MLPIAVLVILIGLLARSWLLSFVPTVNAMERFTPPDEKQRRSAIGPTTGLPKTLQRAFDPADHFEPIPAPGPSDWLANHPEPGQTFEQYRRERVNRPDKIRRKLYLQPLGAFYNARGTAIRLRQGSNSTQVSVRDGVFYNCDQALVNWCDLTSVADCWISSAQEMKDRAVIENHGVLTLANICGVPAVKAENDQRWIDNHGTLTARNFRFGGEGAGFTAVVNFAPYVYTYPVVGPGIVLDSCDIYALGNPKRKAAIFCEQVPNQIVVRNCRGLCDLPVVRVSDKLDLETYFDNAEQRRACLRFLIGDENVEVFDANRELPEPMRPYQANHVVADSPPKSGHWHRGAFIWNRNAEGRWTAGGFVKATTPGDQEPLGWSCVESGKPGTWRAVYPNFAANASRRESE